MRRLKYLVPREFLDRVFNKLLVLRDKQNLAEEIHELERLIEVQCQFNRTRKVFSQNKRLQVLFTCLN